MSDETKVDVAILTEDENGWTLHVRLKPEPQAIDITVNPEVAMSDETNGGPGVIPGSVIRAVAAEMRQAKAEGWLVLGAANFTDEAIIEGIAARVMALKARGWA